jgi:hypothetical protein
MVTKRKPGPTKKARTIMGLIRSMWTVLLVFAGAGITWGVDNILAVGLPPWTALLIGASLYGVKRAIWPDTKW